MNTRHTRALPQIIRHGPALVPVGIDSDCYLAVRSAILAKYCPTFVALEVEQSKHGLKGRPCVYICVPEPLHTED
jgi:hypothetical protein